MLKPYKVIADPDTQIGGVADPTRTLKMDKPSLEWEATVKKLLAQRDEQKRKEEESRKAEEARVAAEKQRIERERQAALKRVQYRNSYTFGNCTYYVASRRSVPPTWGNARAWLYSAQASGWTTGPVPQVGAIAWTSAGPLGHVALVEAIQGNLVKVSEMNYAGYNVISSRWVTAGSFLYIY